MRMHAEADGALTNLPTTDWRLPDPQRSCTDELRISAGVRAKVPRIDTIVADVQVKVQELNFTPVPVQLPEDCVAAIVAYTHDLNTGVGEGTVYFELNNMLRQRGPVRLTHS